MAAPLVFCYRVHELITLSNSEWLLRWEGLSLEDIEATTFG